MANNVKIEIPNDFLNDFQKLGNNIAKNIATEARDKITKEAEYSVSGFYHSYDPKYYKRQFSLYSSFRPYYKNPHSTRIHGGVEFNSDFMDEKGFHQKPEDEMFFGQDGDNYSILSYSLMGNHGGAAITPPWILDHVIRFRDLLYASISPDGSDPITSSAIAKAKSESKYFH